MRCWSSASSRGTSAAPTACPGILGASPNSAATRALAAQHYQRQVTGPRAVAAQLQAWRLYRDLGLPERAELQLDEFLATAPDSTAGVTAGVAGLLVEEGLGGQAVTLLDRALH